MTWSPTILPHNNCGPPLGRMHGEFGPDNPPGIVTTTSEAHAIGIPAPTATGARDVGLGVSIPACLAGNPGVTKPRNGQSKDKSRPNLPLNPPKNELPTPIRHDVLQTYLDNYEDGNLLVAGFAHGFSLGCTSYVENHNPSNLKSALEHKNIVQAKLEKELALGRLAGPFKEKPFVDFVISPVGVVPKKEPGKFRLIHHLSYPKGSSVNDSIPKGASTVSYQSIDDAVKILIGLGPSAFLAKCDIESAFRLLPVNPSDYHLLGIFWEGIYYYDRCVPMGCSSSCALFESFSSSLHWIANHKLGITNMVHVLDDFLIIGHFEKATNNYLNKFQRLCNELGIPLAEDKPRGHPQVLYFWV